MNLQETLSEKIKLAVQSLYSAQLENVEFQATRKDFEGDITVVVFPMLKQVKGNPVQIGEAIGAYLVEQVEEVTAYNVVKGFLNLVLSDAFYIEFFTSISSFSNFGKVSQGNDATLVEYSSPNTNKPLHLGHVRNNLLGYSVAEIIKASGKKVYKTQIINDRGIHICKSMLAWKLFGEGETPESSGLKGDHLVGKYYVKFETEIKIQAAPIFKNYLADDITPPVVGGNEIKKFNREIALLEKDDSKESRAKIKELQGKVYDYARNRTEIMSEAYVLLRKWEAGDEKTVALWKKMNGWVYDGFDETYKAMGVDFDTLYYESETYLLGKEFVQLGLDKEVFEKDTDGSVWCDLTEEGLDRKIVLRSDGTAVYMTQDIGTAIQRAKDFPDVSGMIYTVGNEQEYHFQVLFLIMKKLGFAWAENLYHLSYGMVDLPSGKMKSREGTVVDADDLITEMASTARDISEELGKIDDFSEVEKTALYHTIGLGALKYYILKVDPKKRILFNPEESVDFQGNTGPFIQYTYARIQSILRKGANDDVLSSTIGVDFKLHAKEKELLKILKVFPDIVQQAAAQYSPAVIANYTYDLVKEFNSFYQNVPILVATTSEEKNFRIQLAKAVSEVIKTAFSLLGIDVPERM